jgi:hypothetical protein
VAGGASEAGVMTMNSCWLRPVMSSTSGRNSVAVLGTEGWGRWRRQSVVREVEVGWGVGGELERARGKSLPAG